jgi:hypothetical protein
VAAGLTIEVDQVVPTRPDLKVGCGHIVASEIETPDLFVNLV